jgi:hypothetical protein
MTLFAQALILNSQDKGSLYYQQKELPDGGLFKMMFV